MASSSPNSAPGDVRSTPPPQPPSAPPPYYYHRSYAGPVVLIIVGIVALLANSHRISWGQVGHLYARYWPVLIILWGVIKLAEYYRAREGGYRMRGIGAGSGFLIFWLIIFGIIATHASRVNWGQVSEDTGWEWGDWGGQNYEYTDEAQQALPATTSSVQVNSDNGGITVSTWDQNDIKVVAHKRVNASNENQARDDNEKTKPTITISGDTVVVSANTAGVSRRNFGGPGSVASDLEVFLPKKAAVEVSTRHGDVKVHDRDGNVKASTLHGDMDLENITGAAEASLRRGDMRAASIGGSLAVDGNIGDLDVSKVGGPVKVSAEVTGSLKLSELKKGMQFNSSRTELEVESLDGELDMESGDLHAGKLDGFRISTRSKDIHLDDASGEIHVTNTNGEVNIHATRAPLSNIEIDNRSGDVEVIMPAEAGFQLTATSRRGDVYSDFAGIRNSSERGLNSLSGTVGNGAAHVTITTVNGGIQVRKAG